METTLMKIITTTLMKMMVIKTVAIKIIEKTKIKRIVITIAMEGINIWKPYGLLYSIFY
jgi:hypothetical protein